MVSGGKVVAYITIIILVIIIFTVIIYFIVKKPSSCPDGWTKDDDDNCVAPSCTSDSDCSSGQSCISGFCSVDDETTENVEKKTVVTYTPQLKEVIVTRPIMSQSEKDQNRRPFYNPNYDNEKIGDCNMGCKKIYSGYGGGSERPNTPLDHKIAPNYNEINENITSFSQNKNPVDVVYHNDKTITLQDNTSIIIDEEVYGVPASSQLENTLENIYMLRQDGSLWSSKNGKVWKKLNWNLENNTIHISALDNFLWVQSKNKGMIFNEEGEIIETVNNIKGKRFYGRERNIYAYLESGNSRINPIGEIRSNVKWVDFDEETAYYLESTSSSRAIKVIQGVLIYLS